MALCFPLLFLLTWQQVGAQEPATPPVPAVASNNETGFQSLFNGRDLAGWEIYPFDHRNGNHWSADGGELRTFDNRGRQTAGWLMTSEVFTDFELSLEYKLGEHANSGIALRSPLEGDPSFTGMELALLDDATYPGLNPENYNGAIWGLSPPLQSPARPAGERNQLRVIVNGRRLTAYLNGTVVQERSLDDHTEMAERFPGLLRRTGRIGFQNHTGNAAFRNIQVKRLAGPGTPFLVLDTGGHTSNMWSIMFTPDGRELISFSNDGTIRFWDVQTGETTRVLRPMLIPGGGGNQGALSRDGKLLAVTRSGANGSEQWIYLIALPECRVTRIIDTGIEPQGRLVFSPDGTRLAAVNGAAAKLWNVATGEAVQVFRGHRSGVKGLAISPDGRLLATSSGDETARIWSLETGKSLAVLKDTARRTWTLSSIVFQPDGQGLVTSSWGDLVRVWNLDGTLRRRLPVYANHDIRFTADPNRLLVAGSSAGGPSFSTAFIVDAETGERKAVFAGHNTADIFIGAVSRDGKLAATAGVGGDSLYLWQIEDAKLLHHLGGKARPIWSVGWSEDGHTIAWGHNNDGGGFMQRPRPLERTFDLRDLTLGGKPQGPFLRFRATHGDLSFTRHPNTAIVRLRRGGRDGPELPGQWISGYTFLSDGRFVMSNAMGLCIFDGTTGRRLHKFDPPAGGADLCASPDGRYLLAGGGDGVLRILPLDRSTELLSLFVAGDDWIAWTPEGYYAASPGGENLMGWQINHGPERLGTFAPSSQFHKSLYRPDVIKLALKTGNVAAAVDGLDEAARIVKDVLPPVVLIASPERNGTRLDKPDLTVRAQAIAQSAHPVTAFRLLLDGRPYDDVDRGRKVVLIDPAAGKQRTASWQVRLQPGRHRLAVIAESAVSNGQSDEIEVIYEEQRAAPPRLNVVAIGVSRYPGPLQLRYAADDARAVESVFRARSGSLFESIETRAVLDEHATRREVIKQLNWLSHTMREQDVGLFFFSGHGAVSDGRFYLLSVDAELDDLEATALTAAQLKGILATTKGRLVVLLDACHSGAEAAMLPSSLPIRRIEWSQPILPGARRRSPESPAARIRLLGSRQEGEKRVRPSTDELVRALSNDEHGVITMSSSTGEEVSVESPAWKHGYFTEALTEGLSGRADTNNDGLVYLTELDVYLVNRVKELSNDRQHPVTAKPAGVRPFFLSRSRP